MKTFEQAKSIMEKYVSSSCNSLLSSCSLCCASYGGGKARYQDSAKKDINKK